ncbi:MAG TPA: BatA domain-containing protein, partial [Gammaproteobacteria bacterium]|nr:BatA domain-containing protein [Gammaproteobacteria bacterium]
MSLLAPAFLAGIAAIALPIWLHRLSAENPNRQRFTSLMFLEAGEPRRVLAKKLQYLLLLALRIAALVLLALAFAQPAWLHPPRAAGAKAAKLHIIVMDTSESMSYGDRWQRAEREARNVLDSLGSADRVELVAAGRVPVIVTQPTSDPAAVRRALATLKPGVFHVDYGRLMRSLDGVLTGVNRPVVLDIVTDAQKSAMPARFAELAPHRPAELAIHNVAAAAPENWAVESFTGSPVTGELAATVRSFAKNPATKTLAIELNGRRVASRSVTVKPGGSADVKFDPLDLDAGGNRVTAVLEPGDGLSLDDRRFLALKRPEPRNVLIVSGSGGNGREDLFVDAALKTLATLAIKPQTVAPARLGDAKLDSASFVIVTDAGALAAADVDMLKTYVQSGGAVLLALGRDASTLPAIPITGEQVRSMGAMPGQGGYLSIGSADLSHPAVQGLDELRSAKFFRYVALTPTPDDHVLVELENGAPLLIERQLGSGQVLLFTSTLDREWNDLPVQPVFVPFIAGLANQLLGSAGFSNQAELGSMLSVQSMGLA